MRNTIWAIWRRDDTAMIFTLARTRRGAIELFEQTSGDPWPTWRRKGFRARRAKLQPV